MTEVNVPDSGKCDVKMSCKDYEFILVAGPYSKDLPPAVRELMNEHARTCSCFSSPRSHQRAIDIGVTPAMEEAALKIIETYDLISISLTKEG